MSDGQLKAKLREILTDTQRKSVDVFTDTVYEDTIAAKVVDEAVAQIDAAYKEAGYINYKEGGTIKLPAGILMTDRQFLARFRTELEAMKPLMNPDGYEKFRKAALAVAEKAAGIE